MNLLGVFVKNFVWPVHSKLIDSIEKDINEDLNNYRGYHIGTVFVQLMFLLVGLGVSNLLARNYHQRVSFQGSFCLSSL